MTDRQVFVDESGRRARWVLLVEAVLALAAVGTAVLLTVAMATLG